MSDGRKRRKKRNRRSLRVPVDEVPRPTEGAVVVIAPGAPAAEAPVIEDGGRTVEMPAFDDSWGRTKLEDVDRPAPAESDEAEIPTDIEEPEIEPAAGEEIDESLLDAPREDGDDAPVDDETTDLVALPEEPLKSVEISLDDHLDEGEEVDEGEDVERGEDDGAETGEEEPAEPEVDEAGDEEEDADKREPPPSGPVPSVVIVQRVVQVVGSTPSPPSPGETPSDTLVGADIDMDEVLVDEADASELEGFDLEVEEPEAEQDTEELSVQETDDLLEEEWGDARKRPPSKPPPPPSKSQPAAVAVAPPPPPAAEAEPKPRSGPEGPHRSSGRPAPVKPKRKPRRQWWEGLFNDDYLRTVPIPHPKAIKRECDFIVARFGLAPGATILDVGCGLGLHAVELTRRGYLVVGLDLSLPMLSRAADEAQEHGFKINFLHADMREMNFDGAFDAVLCWGTTFGYFDDDANRGVVERLFRSLKPRGLLLLDVVNRDYVIHGQPNLVWFEGDGCVVMEETKMNYITSRLEVKRTVILDDGRQRDTRYSVRLYSLHELGKVLHQRGFRVVELSGREAHPGVYFGADSPKLIILAERRPQGPPRPPVRSDVPPSGETPVPGGPDEPAEPEAPEVEDVEEPAALVEPEVPSEAVNAAVAEAIEQSEEELETEELEPDEIVDSEELEDPAETEEPEEEELDGED